MTLRSAAPCSATFLALTLAVVPAASAVAQSPITGFSAEHSARERELEWRLIESVEPSTAEA
ncbi:MAG: hypothetical protein M3Y31_04930, partial [Gemmatimonadota bacterium]|nr:hypothetical protein [Gemmatimonadota bacterium]